MVRINFGPAIYRARVQIVLSAPDKTDLVIDQVQMSSSGPLPVELTSFKAEDLGHAVQLHWTTASERSNARFEMERASSGTDFGRIGQVAG